MLYLYNIWLNFMLIYILYRMHIVMCITIYVACMSVYICYIIYNFEQIITIFYSVGILPRQIKRLQMYFTWWNAASILLSHFLTFCMSMHGFIAFFLFFFLRKRSHCPVFLGEKKGEKKKKSYIRITYVYMFLQHL